MLKKNKLKDKNIIFYTLVLCIGIFFSLWLIKSGIIKGHDMDYHFSRIMGLSECIKRGDFRGLIHIGLTGYGYANGLFYSNLFIYIPAMLFTFGINMVKSYKVYVLICNIASAFSMFYCVKKISKSNKIAVLSTYLYSACAYKMCDFIVRSALGEMTAFVFLPLILLGLYEIVYDNYKKWYLFSIGFVCLIQCHIISTVLMAIIMLIFILINYQKFLDEKKRIIYLIIAGVVGIGLGAMFIFPMLEAMVRNDLVIGANSFAVWNNTVKFENLFLGFPYYGSEKFLPSGVGVLFIALLLFRFKIKANKDDKIIKFCDLLSISGLIILLCITDFFPWHEISFLQSVQFPWRLYIYPSLFFSISCPVYVSYYLKNKTKKQIIKFMIPIILIALIPYLITEYHYRRNEIILYHYRFFDIGAGEYLPRNTSIDKLYSSEANIYSNNEKIEMSYKKDGNKVNIKYSNNVIDNSYIDVPLLYYYGYEAKENNELLKIGKGENNVIRIYLKNKSGKVKVYYKETNIQKYSLYLSIISTILLIIYIIRSNKHKNL